MRFQFFPKTSGPERLVCDAEIVFEDGDGILAGMKLVGFSVWQGAAADASMGLPDLYITFPSRAFGTATDRKFFDYLRATEPGSGSARAVKDAMLAEYRRQAGIEEPTEPQPEPPVQISPDLAADLPREVLEKIGYQIPGLEPLVPAPLVSEGLRAADTELERNRVADFVDNSKVGSVEPDDNGGF